MKRVVLIGVVLALLSASEGTAATKPRVSGAGFETPLTLAEKWWGTACESGPVSIQWVNWANPPTNHWGGAAHQDGCARQEWQDPARWAIYLNPAAALSPRRLCVVIFHEYGHLIGKQHSADPRSIMYAGGATVAPKPCRRLSA